MTVKQGRRPEDAETRHVLEGETREQALALAAKYPNARSAILPLLFLVQSVDGYVSDDGMRDVAEILDLTPAQVLATASFYTMLKKQPQGTYLLSVCRNIACTHRGGRKVIAALEDHLGIEVGQTTADGKFTLEAAECLATCDGAPSMQINYEDFYDLTPEKAIDVIERISRGDDVRSHRGQVVKTSKQISGETACAGLRWAEAGIEDARTIGGEVASADTAPGRRPPERGKGQGEA